MQPPSSRYEGRQASLVLQASDLLASSYQRLSGENHSLRRKDRPVPFSRLRWFFDPNILWSHDAARPPCVRGTSTRTRVPRTHSQQRSNKPILHKLERG